MLRPRLGRLVGAAILAATLVLPAIGHRRRRDTHDRNRDAARDQARLRARGPQSARAHLSQPRRRVPLDPARASRSARSACGGPWTAARASSRPPSPSAQHRFADFRIRTGHAYHYFVAGIGADGTRVARAPSSPSGSVGPRSPCASTA